jgi:hypothetical protein
MVSSTVIRRFVLVLAVASLSASTFSSASASCANHINKGLIVTPSMTPTPPHLCKPNDPNSCSADPITIVVDGNPIN